MWDPKSLFRDFTQLDLSHVEDVTYDDDTARIDPRPRKRFRADPGPPASRDKFNLSNDHAYEAIKDTKLVRQTFGALEVEHAYPALKLQMPFVSLLDWCIQVMAADRTSSVQNPPYEAGMPVLPSSRSTLPNQSRDQVQQGQRSCKT